MMLCINYTSIKTGKKSKEILALHIHTYIPTHNFPTEFLLHYVWNFVFWFSPSILNNFSCHHVDLKIGFHRLRTSLFNLLLFGYVGYVPCAFLQTPFLYESIYVFLWIFLSTESLGLRAWTSYGRTVLVSICNSRLTRGRKPWFAAFVNFCCVNTPSKVDFRLSGWTPTLKSSQNINHWLWWASTTTQGFQCIFCLFPPEG